MQTLNACCDESVVRSSLKFAYSPRLLSIYAISVSSWAEYHVFRPPAGRKADGLSPSAVCGGGGGGGGGDGSIHLGRLLSRRPDGSPVFIRTSVTAAAWSGGRNDPRVAGDPGRRDMNRPRSSGPSWPRPPPPPPSVRKVARFSIFLTFEHLFWDFFTVFLCYFFVCNAYVV